MQLDTEKKGAILVARPLDARMDAGVVGNFTEEIIKHIGNGKKLLVLNLSHVDFMDSSGLGAIVSCFKQLGDDGKLVICEMKDPILKLFQLTRLDKILNICALEKDAIELLTS